MPPDIIGRKRRLAGPALGGLVIVLIAGATFAQTTGRWTTAAPLPEERSEVAVAVLDGRIYVVGGLGGRDGLLEYEAAADRWRERASPPISVNHAGFASVGGRLYLVGGYVNGREPSARTVVYDPTSNQWRDVAPLPTARGALAVAVLDGRIHAVGGVGVGPGRRNTAAH